MNHKTRAIMNATIGSIIAATLLSACASSRSGKLEPVTSRDTSKAAESAMAQPNLTDTSVNPGSPTWKRRGPNEVAPGFKVELTYLEDEKLKGAFEIEFDGILKLPYHINVETSGLTEKQLKDKIISAYRAYFQSEPNLQVAVVERGYLVDVRGLVNKSGKFKVKANTSLDELISLAQGLRDGPDGKPLAAYARIQQLGNSDVVRLADYYSGTEGLVPQWQGGDIIFLQSSQNNLGSGTGTDTRYVQVLGQVRFPGEYRYLAEEDFFQYLIRAGGPTAEADLGRVAIVRGAGNNRQSVYFDIEEDIEMLPTIEGGDMIIVHGGVPGALQKRIQNVGSGASIVGTIATIVLLFVTV